ncbi:MAG: hypothetical protein KJ955_08930 [Nanoarchaeota archaeon]|nr:hypothetical protein [Nanoarchaeota archaeon]
MVVTPKDYAAYRELPKDKQREEVLKRIESQLEAAIDAQLLEDASCYRAPRRMHEMHFFLHEFSGLDAKFAPAPLRITEERERISPLTKDEIYAIARNLGEKYMTAGWRVRGDSQSFSDSTHVYIRIFPWD